MKNLKGEVYVLMLKLLVQQHTHFKSHKWGLQVSCEEGRMYVDHGAQVQQRDSGESIANRNGYYKSSQSNY